MFAEERQQLIAERARAEGRVDVGLLAAEYEVTTETIRRDLTVLESRGIVRKVHGGAIPLERLGFEPTVAARDTVQTAAKERIAAAALAEVPAEGAILLDSGTTTARIADALEPDRDLTVVTNSVSIAASLALKPRLTVLIVGGKVRVRTMAAIDDWALRALADTYVDVAFIGTNGISVERGLTTPDTGEAAVKRAMIAAARRSVVVADHTKVGNDCLARFGSLDQVDTFITDTGLDPGVLADLEAVDLKVVRA
ncbi:DeoR/GlpR family DNA-binding transcription regulator [Glycomyces sp. L485]|uniref:DeoR/GlpR family DNA-binding transcription regulator n=1 Tax=Glycomyces sp. L485 TaxID=2909235 RepID=UPI001F4A972F|nr:DeoR/GlpR family DNA-binding transcription regulator [Glycomyces sp. L485]MCH7230387.1 DeoR/GlpR family DNA-binding transcription regulator [Glycomyces sp. L485]